MKLNFTIFAIFINSIFIFSQNYQPIDLAKKLFLTDFPEVKNYSKDEFEGNPNKSDLSQNVKLSFKTLTQNDSIAVVNITVVDSLGKGFDSYLHFEKDEKWMITAFRGLAQTGMLEQMVKEFEKMSDNEIQKILDVEKKGKSKQFKTKEDFILLIENAKLTIDLDDNIIKYFTDNKDKFVELKSEIENYKESNQKLTDKELTKIFEEKLKKLLLNSIGNFYFPCESCFKFTIGGMIDNTVGYFHETDKSKIPQTNPSRIIMIREIGDGWYMFKTT